MSKYTTQVRFICERAAGFSESADYAEVDDILTAAVPKIFNFDFPIFDENYRNVLCKKILKHYYTREIGLETVGLWKLKLDTKMNEIMPYYNKRYESTVLEFNPLYDVDYTRTTEGTDTGTNSSSSTETNVIENESENLRTNNLQESETQSNEIVDKHTGTDQMKRTYNSSEATDEDISKTNTQSGTDKFAKTGTETSKLSGSDNYEKTGTVTDGKTGTETDKITGTDTKTKTGTETDALDRQDNKTHTDAYSDTPQGTVDNVLQGTYLTNFRQVLDGDNEDSTDTKTFNTSEALQHNTNDTKTYNTTDTTTFDTDETTTYGKTDTVTFNTTDTETKNLSDTTTEDNTITRSKSGYDTDDNTKNLTDTKTEDIDITKQNTGTVKDEGSSTINGSKTGSGSGSFENTKDYIEHVVGKMPGHSYARAIMEFRDSIINIDMEIIDELSDLFMKIW